MPDHRMDVTVPNVNMLLLREQRNTLLQLTDRLVDQELEHVEGLISLLDYMVDKALDAGVLS